MPTALPPVDPNVTLPPAIAAQGARADAIHKQAYTNPANPQPDPAPAPTPVNPPVPAPVPQPAPPPPAQHTEPPAPVQPQPAPADRGTPAAEELTAEQWRHRFLSMQGRYNQTAQTVGSMQEQMTEMGDELMRSQRAIEQMRQGVPRQPAQPAQSLVTEEEIGVYGKELIDVVKRAAREAVMPDMQNLHTGVQQVTQRVQQVSTGGVYAQLGAVVPDWAAINASPEFRQWCTLRDVYSGQVRGRLLNAALQAADAPRVIAFFKGFLAEGLATGQLTDPSVQPPPPAVPRTPAVSLLSLATPGRAHPAGGDQPLPADKPIFTRYQVSQFYAAVRQGHYNGREADKARDEQAIFAAQNDGRIR